jgi:hypothetical protein
LRDKSRAAKSVSLNEVERRTEKEQLKARKKAHQQELAALAGETPATYEITLKNAKLPGLPSPLTLQPVKATAEESADEDVSSASDQDVILSEAQRILVDYVGLESPPTPQSHVVGQLGTDARERMPTRSSKPKTQNSKPKTASLPPT